MEDPTFTLRLNEIMNLLENLDVQGVSPVNVVLTMGKLGIKYDKDTPASDTSANLKASEATSARQPASSSKGLQAKGPSKASGIVSSAPISGLSNVSNTAGNNSAQFVGPDEQVLPDKWSSVAVGRKVGIFYGYGASHAYVTSFSHNNHKCFKKKADALAFFWTHYKAGKVYSETGDVLGIEGFTSVPPRTWVVVQE